MGKKEVNFDKNNIAAARRTILKGAMRLYPLAESFSKPSGTDLRMFDE